MTSYSDNTWWRVMREGVFWELTDVVCDGDGYVNSFSFPKLG